MKLSAGKQIIFGMMLGALPFLCWSNIKKVVWSNYRPGCAKVGMTEKELIKSCGKPSDISRRKMITKNGETLYVDLTYTTGVGKWNFVYIRKGKVDYFSEKIK